jgi:small subunit ribosomal protein S15Ae
MQKHGYINEFEIIDDQRAGKIVVDLNGRLNKCGVISPRFDVKLDQFEKLIYQIPLSAKGGLLFL